MAPRKGHIGLIFPFCTISFDAFRSGGYLVELDVRAVAYQISEGKLEAAKEGTVPDNVAPAV
jgi:hypothetical protein